jgi:hypothetical protein
MPPRGVAPARVPFVRCVACSSCRMSQPPTGWALPIPDQTIYILHPQVKLCTKYYSALLTQRTKNRKFGAPHSHISSKNPPHFVCGPTPFLRAV